MVTTPGEGTGSLEKALDLLDAIGAAPEGLGQSELAELLGLPRTTVYRLLATLVARGLLRRDPLRKVYCLGFRCFEMARQAYAMPDLVAAAAMELRLLRDLTGETTYLAALDGREVISLERCDGAHSRRSAAALGERKPVHCTSQGKAILSAMPDEARERFVRDATLKAMTPLTITDRRRLHAELRITRSRGYAIDDEEIVLGVRCVGAPVVDGSGQVRGAISVAGPAYRLTRERLELLGPEVAEAARRVGAQLPALGPDTTPGTEAAVMAVPGPWAFRGAHPLWSADGSRLWWADTLAPSVRLYANGEDREIAMLESPIVGLVRDGDGVIALHERGAQRIGPDGASTALEGWLAGQPLAICNGDAGAIWAAVGLPEAGAAIGLRRGDGALDVQWRIGEPVQCLAWNAGDGCLYAATPASGAILMMRPGHPAVRRLATLPRGSGRIGGLAFDAQGGVWTALGDGWSVIRIAQDGQLDRVVGLPVPCATDLACVTVSEASATQAMNAMNATNATNATDPGNTFNATNTANATDGPANPSPPGPRQRLAITTERQSVSIDALGSAPLSGRLLLLDL
ncbi:IclR family transcriptional regulator [Bordetella genomosp. 10]|uniref:IclR family transcriptional regulator n=1 Tax=Bordetella genomosp. 10 TaxID=1416804 RepID=A0A261S3T3_9BORD|nr:IclR family transcriptional regulator C-terminal domain-containing protein [Bordetella genomosp. 10]OZI31460.1 IclR family transcriptional regulator [Bordetella genomosp. 10]